MRDFKNVSIFHSVLSCICYVITAGKKNSKSSKEKHIKNLQFFLNARNECKVGKDALTTLWLISGADPENFKKRGSNLCTLVKPIGTLSKDDDDGSENVGKKMNLRSFKLNRVYLGPLNMSNAGDFSWG